MAKHSKSDGDSALAEAKARRTEEIEQLRQNDPSFNDIVPAGWVSRETGYPPYLKMLPGTMFRAQVLDRDDSDEFVDQETGEVRPFVRYHLKLLAPTALECRRGPADERGEIIPVAAGQIFTIGEYTSLERELRALMGLEVAIVCNNKRGFKDRKSGEPRSRFEFEAYVSEATERMLTSEQAEDQKYLRDAYREARRLALTNTFRVKPAALITAAAE